MSSSDLAIRVQGLTKTYSIRHQQKAGESTLAETMLRRFRNPFRGGGEVESFDALKDVSFDVKKGDVVGVIGRNGAGKSTLLKILSRITEPTSGRIELYGRIGSLLEVGTGFHPELTGRENVYLNGNILGMSRAEIRKQFDAIVDFAGVEKFLDTPVKRYSSGMYVRLAFAVAAHLRSEILIVDEVLAVGDSEFQRRCLGKMKDISSDGRTVLFVSHNMAAIAVLCQKGIVLDNGNLQSAGETQEIIAAYFKNLKSSKGDDRLTRNYRSRPIATQIKTTSQTGIPCSTFNVGESFVLEIHLGEWPSELRQRVMVGLILKTAGGNPVGASNMRMQGFDGLMESRRSTVVKYSFENPAFSPGEYCFDVLIGDGAADIDHVIDSGSFAIEQTDLFGTGVSPYREHGPIVLKGRWSING